MSFQGEDQSGTQPGAEVLSQGEPHESMRGRGFARRYRYVGAGIVGVVVLASAGAGFATGMFVGGGGAQPEDVLPSSVMFYADVDLDPSAEQKLNLVRLLGRFPDVEREYGSEPDIRALLIDGLTEGTALESANVSEWAGDRVGGGLSWDADDQTLTPVLAIEVTDEDRALADLGSVVDADQVAPSEAADGYVIVTGDVSELLDAADQELAGTDAFGSDVPALTSQTAAEIAGAASDSPLSDADAFVDVFERVGEGLSTVYFDGAAMAAAAQQMADTWNLDDEAFADPLTGLAEAGVAGGVVRADPDAIEFIAWSSAAPPTGDQPVGIVSGLPDSTLFALEFTGGSEYVAEQWESVVEGAAAELPPNTLDRALAQIEAQTGLRLPADLETLFGDDVALAVDGEGLLTGVPGIGVRSVTDPDAGAELALRLERALATWTGGFGITAEGTDDGMVVASSDEFADILKSGDGGLGSSAEFQRAIPEAESAAYVVWLDFAAVSGTLALAQPEAADVLGPLESFGLGVSPDDDGSLVRARLVFADAD
jgi:hypothetical protein